MSTISVQEAQAKLPELIHELKPGDEVVITDNNQPVARLIPTGARSTRRKLGSLRGTVKHMATDFGAPIEDFKDYTG